MDIEELRSDSGSGTGSGPLRRVRRRTRTAGLKRSRTGCGTCKRRGKKCDEEWNANGWCQRCVLGEFECTGRTQLHTSIGTTTTTTTTASAEDTLSPEGESLTTSDGSHLTSPTTTTTLASQSISFTPTIPSASAPATATVSTTSFPTHASSTPTQTSHGSSFGTYPYTYPQYQQQHHHHHQQAWTGLGSGPGVSSSGLSTFFPTSNLNPYDPAASASTSTSILDTSTLTWNNSSYASTSDLSPLEGNTNTNIWNDFAFSFINSSPGQTITSTSTSDSTTTNTNTAANHDFGAGVNNSQVGGGDPHLVFMNGNKPMRQGVSLAEIYARVVESWLIGLPSTTRDYARARILALNDNNSVLRNVRYAVATAYIFLFASDHKGGRNKDPQPQPKLVEMAWQGAGIVDGQSRTGNVSAVGSGAGTVTGASTSTKGKNGRKGARGDGEGKAQTSNKIKIYVDHVSTPFAADLESRKWTEDAVQELREVIVTDQAQLSNLLWGVIDLQLVEFIRGGAAPSYSMLALGDRLVRSAMGENHPPITLRRLRTSDTLSLRFYALSDISRCIVQRGRKTIFNFWTDVGDMDDTNPEMAENGDDEPWATYLGLPDSIVILLAEVVNLCAELSCSSSTSIKAQADELESALRGWQSQTFTTTTGSSVDSSALVSRTIAGELWRLSALILLYQSVHKVGGLHPILRRCQKEILSLLDSIVRLPNGDLWGFIALPAFLAACLSISENDRKRALGHLHRPGPERVWLDNIALVEKLWEEVDETGRLSDWYDKMTREGLSVAFF